jgi:hypothetical protein
MSPYEVELDKFKKKDFLGAELDDEIVASCKRKIIK